MTRLGRKTGPKPGFSRSDVVDAALEIGVDSFTMAQVAQRLGVRPSALYRTVDSRDDVVSACLERVSAQIRLPPERLGWEDYLRGLAECVWGTLEAHPGLDRTLMAMPWTSLHLMGLAQRAHATLVSASLGSREAYFALDFIIDTTVATHQAVAALRAPAPGQRVLADNGDRAQEPRGFDVLTRHWEEMKAAGIPEGGDAHPFHPEESWLERGLLDHKIELIIDGVRARQERQRSQ